MFKASWMPAGFFSPDKTRLSVWAYVFLGLLCIAFFTPGLVSLPPVDRDESSFAQASKQMIESGNYVDIRIQNEPRYKKPIGIYWLQAASVKLFDGDHLNEIWAYRLPSFLSAIIAVLTTTALGALLFGPQAGILAGIMMAGCVILNVEARQAKTDATLLACIMLTQYALAKAYMRQAQTYCTPLLFWTALGAGILVKGPIVLLVLFSTLLWLSLADKNLKWFAALKPALGVPYTLLLTLPWLVAISLATHGKFLQQSAGHDMFGKILNGEFRGILPPGLHLLVFPLVFFPFSLFALLAIPDSWKNRRNSGVKFCLGWIIPTWVVFELSLTKLPHYVLPAYPAIAMLAAKAMLDGLPALTAHRWRWLPPIAIGIWLLAGTTVALALVILPSITGHIWSSWQIAAGGILILTQGASLFLLFRRKTDAVPTLALGSLVMIGCAFGVTLPELQHIWLARDITQIATREKPCEKLQIVSATYNEPSFIFQAGTDTEFEASGALAAASIWANPCRIAVIDEEHSKSFHDVFPNPSYQPINIGTVEGFNMGRGTPILIKLYMMPHADKTP